jgi:hypothetical protein
MLVMLVDNRVALTARDQPPIYGKRRGARDQQGDREASPEQGGVQPCVHGARDQDHNGVVDYFHDGDRDGVGG